MATTTTFEGWNKNLPEVRIAEPIADNILDDGQHYKTLVAGSRTLADLGLWNLATWQVAPTGSSATKCLCQNRHHNTASLTDYPTRFLDRWRPTMDWRKPYYGTPPRTSTTRPASTSVETRRSITNA